ncbi:MAG TPA: DinB family protein [Flavobacteriales bacterium]
MIKKPTSSNGWLDQYLDLVTEDDLITGFKNQTSESLEFFSGLTEEQLLYRYEEGKWNIKELLVHMMDAERVFCYRALRFARYDQTVLAGYSHNDYVMNSKASERSIRSLLEEYAVVRTATVALFSNFAPEVLDNRGVANGVDMCVAAIGFAILGHERHHLQVIREKYLKA